MAIIVLLQQDLRIDDNPALYYAAERDLPIVVVYVIARRTGYAQQWWYGQSFLSYKSDLEKWGIPLLFYDGLISDLLKKLKNHIPLDALYWNSLDQDMSHYEKDTNNKKFYPNLLFPPDQVQREFKLCAPFVKHCLKNVTVTKPLGIPFFKSVHRAKQQSFKEFSLPKLPADKNKSDFWSVGEKAAYVRWDTFKKDFLKTYETDKNVLDSYCSSLLSPYLQNGQISIRRIWYELKKEHHSVGKEKFLAELGWREFSYNLLFHHKDLATVPLKKEFAYFDWKSNQKHMTAWKEGKTGVPIIDAAMRQLKTIGWMNNRMRMVVASFLTKNLRISWQKGEQWFFENLVDADSAANGTNWQWVAGCGTDSSPFFRIFNPILQGKTYDSEGNFIKQWIPELKGIENKFLHEPWLFEQEKKVKLYISPLVNISESRKAALDAYKKIKKEKQK